MKTYKDPIPLLWAYRHKFGIISFSNVNMLVVTENAYFDCDHCRYTYYKVCDLSETEQLNRRELVDSLNEIFGLSDRLYFDSKTSQEVLLKIADIFPESEIRK